MGQATKIQWTDHTFNPWMGCAKAHAGCTNCYAEKALPVTMRPGGKLQWGEVWQGGQRVVKADSGWREPMKWAREAARAGERRRVFCASLADMLEVPTVPPGSLAPLKYMDAMKRVEETREALDAARARLWDVIRQTVTVLPDGTQGSPENGIAGYSGLDWLILTKRPENWELVPEDVRPFVWLGTSISDQGTADEWVPRLLQAKGFRYRFLSLEPMVGPVDLSRFLESSDGFVDRGDGQGPVHVDDGAVGIDWVIVGGESGAKSRPCSVSWVRKVLDQCKAVGVPCFIKQMGSKPGWATTVEGPPWVPWGLSDSKGGDMAEWPEDLRVRELPKGSA